MTGNAADVVIVGAGAVGASIAYEMAKRGVSVLVLEGGDQPGNGCSYANAGLLAPSHVEPLATPTNIALGLRCMFSPDSPFYVHPSPKILPQLLRLAASATPRRTQLLTLRMRELAERGLTLHRKYAETGLQTGFRQSGSLDVFLTEKKFERTALHLGTSSSGLSPHTILSAFEARAMEPSLGELAGAIYRPNEAQCNSLEFVRATLAAAEEKGARVLWGTQVHRLAVKGEQIAAVETNKGRFFGDTYVIAAGLGSQRLCESAGINMPMLGAKGYVIDLKVNKPAPLIPLTFKELKVVATPYPDRLRLCGTLELGSAPELISARRVKAIRDAGKRFRPNLKVSRTLETWTGQRPCTADGVPPLGKSRIRNNLVVAAGHGMWSLILAPVTGELIAEGIVEAAPTLDQPAFPPDRFGKSR